MHLLEEMQKCEYYGHLLIHSCRFSFCGFYIMQYPKFLRSLILVLCSTFLLSHTVIAEQSKQPQSTQKTQTATKLYRVIDKNGNVSYSDTPSPGATEVVMQQVPSINLKPPKIEFKEIEAQNRSDSRSNTGHYTSIKFLDLQQDGVIRNNGGVATLTASLQPALDNGHYLKFYLDGKMIGQQQKALSVTAENVEYGPHTASYTVVAANGTKIQESDTVKFNLLHIVRKKSGAGAGAGGAAANLLNRNAFESKLPKHPKLPSYESMKKKDKTDK